MASGHLDPPFPLLSLLWEKNLVLVFHFVVAFVYSEIIETHFIANGIPFQEKKKEQPFFFLTNYSVLGTFSIKEVHIYCIHQSLQCLH